MRGLLVLMLTAVLAACSLPSASPPPEPAPPSISPSKPQATEPPKATTRDRIQAELAAGDFQAALARLAREIRAGRPEGTFAKELPQALNGVLAEADDHLGAGRCGEAGILLRQAMETYPQHPDLAAGITKPLAVIQEERLACADRLMEQGLLAYRDGRLPEAITTWKRLLAFFPDHEAARQAVETATLQLENLKTIE